MSIAIEVKNISHNFKDKVVCDNISMDFEEDKIYGLLGKNGAGKSTLINIITNQLICDSGEVKIFGKNPREDVSVLEDVCVVREKEFFDATYKVKDIFKAYSYFYKDYDYKLQDKLCRLFEINKKLVYKKLSRGMKTLVSNIIGICSNAPITIFDEPTIGLDAVNRQEFYNVLLESYMDKNRTIIISTHLINEVEELLEKVLMIKDGKVKVDDYIDEVRDKSHYISGKREDLNRLSILQEMILAKSFGNNKMCAYYGDINNEDFIMIENSDIELDKMSLQDLFINMNKKEEALYEK
ncbi:ABC transporter ATP-binding protein [Terrisporobacter mayombei]|uniref:Vitamin B12 import ATP-binding protein BtuD n=1 Tax=Terrisporobacter mayombei TaxID=1541 RepID=A0ABY9Q6T4_9FIRM|nr:ABC transporter ATP-binding protein [Terrisporobacter mayombei]MCC3869086.1 ABC transporter ATP-binding protein [Terrisporobacter mayombei]WMT82780.1 Vitamin B12 import ATP-binding protein BtuD [Terrisporobacter mayombei]